MTTRISILSRRVASDKALGRQSGDLHNPSLSSRVDFKYSRIELDSVPLKWIKVWNLLSYPKLDISVCQPVQEFLCEQRIVHIYRFMYKFLVSSISEEELTVLDKLYNVLLSIL